MTTTGKMKILVLCWQVRRLLEGEGGWGQAAAQQGWRDQWLGVPGQQQLKKLHSKDSMTKGWLGLVSP